ncbi:MAG: phage tail tape measure protein [Pseudomonadota bacterium]
MANELLVGVKIGAVLSGTFQAAFASARGTSLKLGQAADELRVKHARLGEVMARAMSHPTRNVGELRRQYERLGQTIDQLRAKQEKLAASMARGEALKAARADLRGQAMETAGTAVALGAPVVQSVRLAAGFQDQMRDIAITGEFTRAEEARISGTVRDSATRWNQTQAEIGRGLGVLVAGGIQDAKALEHYAPVMAKAATATRASMDDLGSVAIALKDNLKVGEEGFEGALNMLAYAGKRGQFEIRDMAKWLPALSPSFQALGVTGKEAVAEIGAALQIARKGAGSNDEAANNFKNFLQKITAPDTLKDFEKAGIDLKGSMMNLRAQGLTPVQSMLAIITQYMQSKGPAAAGQFQQAMAIKDDKEREAALQRLSEAYKLGELFQDMQAMSFIRPAIANQGEMKDIKQGSMEAGDKGLLDADFKKRMEGATEQFKAFKIGLMDIGITIGDALLPPLTELLQEVRPGIKAFGDWAKEHPGLIKGVIGLVGGLLAGKMAFIGIKYGLNLVLSPFNALTTSITAVSGKWTLLRAMWQAGRFAPAIAGLRSIGGGILAVGRFLVPFGQGLLMTFGAPLMLVGRGALFLGRLLVGNLVPGLRLAGQAVLWLGRAMLLNPIGLAVTAIGVAAYLVWKNWDKVKGAVMAGWNWLKGVKNQFFAAGADLINGLVNGVTSKLTAARDSIVSFGSSIKGWFADTLGIKSPSRVFMGFGDNIAQGAAIGIGRSAGLASKAAAGMASDTAAAAQRINAGRAGAGAAAGGAGGMTIQFSPTIHVQGGAAEAVKSQVTEALNLSLRELEQLIARVSAQQARRAY